MSKREKLLEKLRQNPKNVRFDDIDTLLSGLGFEKRQRGSHVTFSQKACGRITVPIKNHLYCLFMSGKYWIYWKRRG